MIYHLAIIILSSVLQMVLFVSNYLVVYWPHRCLWYDLMRYFCDSSREVEVFPMMLSRAEYFAFYFQFVISDYRFYS